MKVLRISKSVLVSGLLIGSATIAATGLITLDEVNQKVAALVEPLNNQETEMSFSFTRLAVDSVRATDFGLSANFLKKGMKNDVELSIPTLEYSYGDGKNPTAKLDLSLKLDVLKTFGQETINLFSESLEEMAVDSAKEFTKEYGAAANITANLLEKKTDANGNIKSVKMNIAVKIDVNKLPATKPVSEVEIKAMDLEVLGTQDGFKLSGTVVMNPEYRRFEVGDDGLKEYVEKLLNDDQEAYMELGQLLALVNSVMSSLAEMEAQ